MTERQRRFAEYYLETGNARQSAIRAGYSVHYAQHVKSQKAVREYLKLRRHEMDDDRVASANEILEFLTDVMRGKAADKNGVSLQVRAAEMLARRMGYGRESAQTAVRVDRAAGL